MRECVQRRPPNLRPGVVYVRVLVTSEEQQDSSRRRSSALGKAGADKSHGVCLARELPAAARAAHSPRGKVGLGWGVTGRWSGFPNVPPSRPSHSSLSPGRHPVPSRCQAPSCQGGQCAISSSARRCVRPLPRKERAEVAGRPGWGAGGRRHHREPRSSGARAGAPGRRGGACGRRGGAEAGPGRAGGGASSPAPPLPSPPARSGPGRPRGNPGPGPSCLARLRELRQPGQRADRHPGHERLPDRHEEAQGAAEAAQRRQSPVLSASGSVPRGRPGLAQVTRGGGA
ncbi:CUGBP Elav-like family member 4 isoform X7 [Sigmodon hispidus]